MIAAKRICDIVSTSPAAEDVLDDAGVDYWFGWERPLRDACAAAHVDAAALEARLAACPIGGRCGERPVTLLALLRESDEQWSNRLEPAIAAASRSVFGMSGGRGRTATQLLEELRTLLERHMQTSRSLQAAAAAIERGSMGVVSKETLRRLGLGHLAFIGIADDLRNEAARLAEAEDKTGVAAALRRVVRETRRHVRVGYNFIVPRLLPVVRSRAPAGELVDRLHAGRDDDFDFARRHGPKS